MSIIRFVNQMIENDIYTVSSLGTTTSADWITCGSCLDGQDFPNIGRQFKCLSSSITGTGTVIDTQINLLSGTITIGGDVEVSNFPPFPAIQAVSGNVNVDNFPTFPAIQAVSDREC